MTHTTLMPGMKAYLVPQKNSNACDKNIFGYIREIYSEEDENKEEKSYIIFRSQDNPNEIQYTKNYILVVKDPSMKDSLFNCFIKSTKIVESANGFVSDNVCEVSLSGFFEKRENSRRELKTTGKIHLGNTGTSIDCIVENIGVGGIKCSLSETDAVKIKANESKDLYCAFDIPGYGRIKMTGVIAWSKKEVSNLYSIGIKKIYSDSHSSKRIKIFSEELTCDSIDSFKNELSETKK